jgi:hypothetical protein
MFRNQMFTMNLGVRKVEKVVEVSNVVHVTNQSIDIYQKNQLQIFVSKNEYDKRRTDDEMYAPETIGKMARNGRRNRRFLDVSHKMK